MPEKRGAWTGEEASCLIWDCSVPWAPLLCVTRAELIQAGWHFPAHSHLCARSTAGEHWLSWRPCTTCGGACWNKGEPSSSSDTRVGTAAFSKWKMGNCFSPFCASFLPLSQLCHCRTKKFPGTEGSAFPEVHEVLLRIPSCLCPCLFFYSGWWLF